MEMTSISHYRIIEKLGAGGMGDVYLAEDTRLGRKVALKLLAQELTQNRDRLSRFDQEAYAASALNHPNILTIYEMGDEGGRHYIATEFVDGVTLRKRLSSGAPACRRCTARAHLRSVFHRARGVAHSIRLFRPRARELCVD